MTDEILLYPRRSDQTWDEVVAADAEETSEDVLGDEVALAQGVATFARMEARLREELTGPVTTWVAEEVGGDVFGELSAPGSGLQVELYHGSASVGVVAAEGLDAEEHERLVRRAVEVVAEVTGYEAYDPQTRASFDGTVTIPAASHDADAGIDADAGEGSDAEAAAAASASPASTRPDPRQDPGFARRRGRLYVIIGVLATAYGAWRLSVGDAGILTYLVLGIGVFDLLGGLAMFKLANSMEASSAPAGTADAAASGEAAEGDQPRA